MKSMQTNVGDVKVFVSRERGWLVADYCDRQGLPISHPIYTDKHSGMLYTVAKAMSWVIEKDLQNVVS